MAKPLNLQDMFLNCARRERIPVTIHVQNGYQINNAVIVGYDSFVLFVDIEGKQMMIYKHAISTITPKRRAVFTNQDLQREEQSISEETYAE